MLSLAPSGVVNVGNSVIVNCSLGYSAPTESNGNKPLSVAQNPVLNISFDGVPVSSTVTTYTPRIGQYVKAEVRYNSYISLLALA